MKLASIFLESSNLSFKLILLLVVSQTFQITHNFKVKSRMRSVESNQNNYKFYLMNSELAPPKNAVLCALDNLTVSDLGSVAGAFCKQGNQTSTNGTTFNSSTICTDAAGKFNNETAKNRVTHAPFVVKTCDQVLYISGAQRLMNYDDCSAREPAFFTMSVFMVNFFRKNISSTLQQSILIDDMTQMPSFVPGTMKQCLDFRDSRTPGGFAICFKDPGVTATLYASFLNFMKCRMGDNLKPLTLPQLKKIYQLTCAGKAIDPRMIFSNDKNALIHSIEENFKSKKLNPYFGLFPPGVPNDYGKPKKRQDDEFNTNIIY